MTTKSAAPAFMVVEAGQKCCQQREVFLTYAPVVPSFRTPRKLGQPILLQIRKLKPGPARRAFWQSRFYDFNVWSSKKRIEKLRYLHRNPVKRRLVRSPEQWRWSSYRYYLLDEAGPVRVNVGWGAISFHNRVA